MRKKEILILFCLLNIFILTACASGGRTYRMENITFNNSIAYDKNGSVPVTGTVKEYSDTGELISETSYKDGKKQGIAKGYYDSGALMLERHFNNGEVTGTVKVFYESGALKREQPFINGKLNGLVKSYSKSGELETQTLFKDGKVVTTSPEK